MLDLIKHAEDGSPSATRLLSLCFISVCSKLVKSSLSTQPGHFKAVSVAKHFKSINSNVHFVI